MTAIDGSIAPLYIKLDCGAWGEFDDGSGYGYRCTHCGAVVGSVSEPRACADKRAKAEEKRQVWKALSKHVA
jgi:hypothetical protein